MDYIRGNLAPVPQDESQVTVARKINKQESSINWSDSARLIDGKIRGFVYGPGTYTLYQGKKLKLHKATVADVPYSSGRLLRVKLFPLVKIIFLYACGEGVLKLWEVQPESL